MEYIDSCVSRRKSLCVLGFVTTNQRREQQRLNVDKVKVECLDTLYKKVSIINLKISLEQVYN